LNNEKSLRLPELEPLLELDRPQIWFPILEMCGGFNFRLIVEREDVKLISESWSRIVGGSGQGNVVTVEGNTLEAEGFA
jgi:hypothetical protein